MTKDEFYVAFSKNRKYVCAADFLKYKKPYNFLAIARGAGKSTMAGGIMIAEWIFSGRRTIYTRRTAEESELTAQTLCDDAAVIASDLLGRHIDVTLKNVKMPGMQKMKAYVIKDGDKDPAVCGRVIPLSGQAKFKSFNLSDTDTILYDEFLPDVRTGQGYLGGADHPYAECTAMLSLFRTVDRGLDVPYRNAAKVIFMGNTSTIYSPFFSRYGVDRELERNPGARLICPKDAPWLLYRPAVEAVTQAFKESNVFKLSDESDIAYNFGSNGTDSQSFIERITAPLEPFCVVRARNKSFRFSHVVGSTLIYMDKGASAFAPVFSADDESHTADDVLVRSWAGSPWMSMIGQAYMCGQLRFQTGECRAVLLDLLGLA